MPDAERPFAVPCCEMLPDALPIARRTHRAGDLCRCAILARRPPGGRHNTNGSHDMHAPIHYMIFSL